MSIHNVSTHKLIILHEGVTIFQLCLKTAVMFSYMSNGSNYAYCHPGVGDIMNVLTASFTWDLIDDHVLNTARNMSTNCHCNCFNHQSE